MKERNYQAIDSFRFFAAVLIIAIHTSPLSSVSGGADLILTGILARVAVPFFFMTTGFFLFSQNRIKTFSYREFLIKTGRLYAVSMLLYLPLNLYAGHFSGRDVLYKMAKAVLADGTFYHLWYFPALMLGGCFTALLIKHLSPRAVSAAAGILYLTGLLGDSYYGIAAQIPAVKSFYDVLFLFFSYTRNGLFFAPLYLLLGAWISRHPPVRSIKVTIAAFLVSLSLLITEGLLVHRYSLPRHDSMYVFLIPCMFFLFQLLLLCKGGSRRSVRAIPMILYIIHPWCIVLIRGFAKLIGAQPLLVGNSVINFASVVLLSAAVSIPLGLLLETKKKPEAAVGRAFAEINLSNLRHNLRELESILPQGCLLMAVVKADAYGHGAVKIASELQKAGVKAFAVAALPEGIKLRKSGIRGDILILGYTDPGEIPKLRRYHLIQTAADFTHAEALNSFGKKVRVHIKIDTGMHRSGEDSNHRGAVEDMLHFPNLIAEGLYTHLCVPDSPLPEDRDFTLQQIENFKSLADYLKVQGCCPACLHIQSSYGVLNYPEIRGCSYARIGIALYGALSGGNDPTEIKADLRPVLSVRAAVTVVKELAPGQTVGYGRRFKAASPMIIATISIGYADGVFRNLKDGYILIKGQKAPVLGRISMDQLTVDITGIPDVHPGDVATVIGQDGEESIPVEQFAAQCGTISNEILSRLGERLDKVYI